MKRNTTDLGRSEFDVLVIGGGITGACLALDATLRGLSVALVEKNDFGAATSSASSKLLHGGIRYLQQLNLYKVHESAHERMYFQRLAPHLTYLIPFIIPAYSRFSKGKLVLKTALLLYEALCAGQNRIPGDPAKTIPAGRMLSKEEVRDFIPVLESEDITGGISIHECHMYNSERMTLGFLDTAEKHGAVIANYTAAISFLGADKGRVRGIRARDLMTDTDFDIRAGLVLNAAGPWIPGLNKNIGSRHRIEGIVSAFSKGAHIITRPLTRGYAVALPTKQRTQTVIDRGGRHIFIIPWREHSLIGTTYTPYEGNPDDVHATKADVLELLTEINAALGREILRSEDILHAYAGLYPLTDDVIRPKVYQGTGNYQIVDHAGKDGLDGLVSVFGAKFTTARLLAEKALDIVTPRFNKMVERCKTRDYRLASGNIENISHYRAEQQARYAAQLDAPTIEYLVTTYGTGIDSVIKYIDGNKPLGETLAPGRQVLAAQIIHAAREEMACHLEDAVFRRTDLGTLGNPGMEALQRAALLMGKELGWDAVKTEQEVARVSSLFVTTAG